MDWRKIILFLLLTLPIPAAAQRIAVKSNVLYLAAGTPDVGAELVIGERTSLSLSVSGTHNPYWRDKSLGEEVSTRFIALQPELRYWFNGRPLTRFYAGVSMIASAYDYPFRGTLYQGNALGAGLTAGYAFNLTRRLDLELSTGAGLLFFRSKREEDFSKGYMLCPQKLGVTLVYIIK